MRQGLSIIVPGRPLNHSIAFAKVPVDISTLDVGGCPNSSPQSRGGELGLAFLNGEDGKEGYRHGCTTYSI